MKKSLLIRILSALGGISLWLTGLAILAEMFFRVPVSATVAARLGGHDPIAVLLALVLAILLCVFGTCCILTLCSRRAVRHSSYVMQKGENGSIGVSVRSIEGLVQTCVKQHASIASAEISIVERRDGIVILMHVQEEAGVNIPLAVGAMQKQIRQYVNACTGLDVQEVRVMVESTGLNVSAAALGVPDSVPVPETLPPVLAEDVSAAALPAEDAADTVPADEPVGVVMPPMPELVADEDDRPLHQRLFGAEDEPAIVPAPPQMTLEPESDPTEAAPADEPVPDADEAANDTADEASALDPNAVMEVIEAMRGENDDMQADIPADEVSADDASDPITQDQ